MGNLGLLFRHPSVLLGRREYIFVLGHMRSYSSLVAHLLGSHPEISGYAEMNVPLTRRIDLLRLRAEVARSVGGRLDGRFVLDKVLHDYHPVGHSLLTDPKVRPIFLVRRPAETLSSILNLPNMPRYANEEGAVAYYIGRLATLERLAHERASDALVVRAETLLGEPEAALDRIRCFLGLARPIDTTYSTFPLTGVPGRGDFSPAIREGRILRAGAGSTRLSVRSDVLASADDAYVRCVDTLEGLFGAATSTGPRGLTTHVAP